MPPDLIAALSPPAAPPGSTAPPGGTAVLTGSPNTVLFASLLAATALTAPAAPLSPGTAPLWHTTTVLTKVSFPPVTLPPGTDPTEPVAPAPRKPVLCETELLGAKLTETEPTETESTETESTETEPTKTEPTGAKKAGEQAPAAAVLAPPLLLPPPVLLTTAQKVEPDTAEATPADAKIDSKPKETKRNQKEPMDTASAPAPTGELLLPPAPPTAGLLALPWVSPAAAVPSAAVPSAAVPAATVSFAAVPPAGSALPAVTRAAPWTGKEPLAAATASPTQNDTSATGTPPTATAAPSVFASPVMGSGLMPVSPDTLTRVGESAAPVLSVPTQPGKTPADKNLPGKTSQKDLKTAGVRADTSTRTQTELPRLAHPSRKDTPTEESRTEEGRTEARGDTGQGLASALTLAPAPTAELSAGMTAAPETIETKALTHTEKLEIVQQLADGAGTLRLSAKPGATEEMTVQLHPKDWGSLHVTVQIAPSVDAQAVKDSARGDAPKASVPKTVTAQIVAETPQVKAALESHTGELHQKLREAGLHLDSVTVTVRTPEASKISGTTQGSAADTQGRFQDGSQGSSQGGTLGQAGTQGSDFGQGSSLGQGGDFGQRLTDVGGRPEGSLGSSAGPALSGGGASGSHTGSSGGRQGSQTPPQNLRWAGAETEADTAPRWAARQSGAVRLDLRA